MYTTLNKIREHSPCKGGWRKLLKHLKKQKPDDEPLSLLTILDSNGVYDTLWCFSAVEGFEKEKLLLGIGFARDVEHLMPAKSKKSLDVFERYANGLSTQDEFEATHKAAYITYANAYANAADADAYANAYAAYAAWSAARAAYAVAAVAAAYATDYATTPADAYALAGAREAMKVKQEAQLRQLLEKTCTQL